MSAKHEASWWHRGAKGLVCDLCPHRCLFSSDITRGYCGLRFREGETLFTAGWESLSAIQLDPIEKKPLYHFLPGSSVLSFGMTGCNLGCLHCQNWHLSASRESKDQAYHLTADQIVDMALEQGTKSVAFTYNEPLISAEFWIEVAKLCHQKGLMTVAVSNGFAEDACAQEFFSHMDAANIDLKGFTENFYRKICKGRLQPVLNCLETIHKLGTCHLEVTTLLIPGQNDQPSELKDLSQWIAHSLGKETPLHFSAFHPDYKALNWQPTLTSKILDACRIAQSEGLSFVYSGNVQERTYSDTRCPSCGYAVIQRYSMDRIENKLTPENCCPKCSTPIPGKMS